MTPEEIICTFMESKPTDMIQRRTREQADEDTRKQNEYTAQTCSYCIHGDHESPIPNGETCTCPCHGLSQ